MEPTTIARLGLHARAYVQRGWSVLPLWWPTANGECACRVSGCDSVGKHPVRRLVPHGLLDATNHAQTVDQWWRTFPLANVAIRTGTGGGPVVLDVDGEVGLLALRGLVARHGSFQAVWVRTGSGGWHAYFAHPGPTVPNSAGRVGDGLDVRADGGYVVAPPSRHGSSRQYRWAHGPDGERALDRDLPAMPAWLLHLALPPAIDSPSAHPVWLRSVDASAYATAALERELREVAQAPHGQRNHQLNRSAFKLGQLVGARLLDESTVANALLTAGLAAGPNESKIRATVRRAVRAGMCQPRRVELQGSAGDTGAC